MKKNTTSKNTKNTNTTAMRKDTTMKKNMNTTAKVTATDITDKIIAEALNSENASLRWFKAWINPDFYISRRNRDYSFYNKLLLAMQDAPEGEYATFKQITTEGGKIPKGMHGYKVVQSWFKNIERKDADGNPILDKDGKPQTWKKFSQKYETVFNVVECGLEQKHKDKRRTATITETDLIAIAESTIDGYIKSSGVTFKNKSNSVQAYYNPMTDTVRVPRIQQYNEVGEYYSTTFHELVHSTGHPTRRHRFDAGADKFGSKNYSKEELVAESGAVIALARLGIATEKTFKNSIAYLMNWLKSADRNDSTKRNTLFASIQSAESAVKMIFADK